MQETIKAKRADVARIVNATFPEYRGRTFTIRAAESVTLRDLNWSGGTRSEYRAATLDGRAYGRAADNYSAPWDNRQEGARVDVPIGAAIVRHSIFCGRDSGLTVYVNPQSLAALLPNRTVNHA